MIEFTERQVDDGGFDVVIDNFKIPKIKAHKLPSGKISFTLDHRFGSPTFENLGQAEDFIWFVANAMAVAAGYSSFGENSIPTNPFADRYRIGTSSSESIGGIKEGQ
jgi:hypothetical protein